MNIPLLRRIQRQIDKAPERFQMAGWRKETECGTAFCIAGWAQALTGVHADVARELGIHHDYEMQERLIWMRNWPVQFRGNDDGSPEAADRAIRRIERFIQTEGRE